MQLPNETPIFNEKGECIGVSTIDVSGNRVHFIYEKNHKNPSASACYMVTIDLMLLERAKNEQTYGIPKHLEGSNRPAVAIRDEWGKKSRNKLKAVGPQVV